MPQIFETKHKLPFGIFSSSVNTGYNAEISSSFQPGIDITNLHNDNYASYEDSPAQGPFTEAHVGGNQHRHVPLNTGSQTAETRPEAFLINFDVPGELRIYGPDLVDTARPRASMLRGNAAKSPLNIENIRSVTGSLVLGNYQRDYEIVQTSGRRINNRYLTKVGDIPVTASNSIYVTGLVGYDLPDRENTGSNKFIFVERFNAPGGPDVSSRGVLDIEAEEMAPNNALPFRNLNVKLPLRSFLTQHSAQFGYSSLPEHTASWFTSEASASYHKVNRNTLFRPEENKSLGNMTCLEFQYVENSFIGETAQIGFDVDTSGSLSIISAPGADSGGIIFVVRSGSSGWVEEEQITTGSASDRFGDSVSLDRNYIVVGAPKSGSAGAVLIYRSGSSGWDPAEQIITGISASSDFGNDVQKYGDLLVVGASGSISGSAFIYRSGSSGWNLEVELTGGAAGSGFGRSVALENDFLVVGAPSSSTDPGELRIFVSSSSGWNLGQVVAGDATKVDGLGWELSMQNQSVVAGVRDTLSASVGPQFYQRSGDTISTLSVDSFGEVLSVKSVDVHECLALVSTDGGVFVYGQESDGVATAWRRLRVISGFSPDAVALDDNTVVFGFGAFGSGAGTANIYDYCLEKLSCVAVYDNWFVQHMIPRSDLRYSWITASALTRECDLFGYQKDGRITNRGHAYTDIEFVGARRGGGSAQGGFAPESDRTILGDFLGITGTSRSSSVDVDSLTWNNSILELWVNNGAYEYPIWKQTRTGEHPVARALKAANIIAVQDEPKSIVVDRSGTRRVVRAKNSDTFRSFVETPVSSRYRPIGHQLMFKGSINPLLAHEIVHTYGNNLGLFANKELENRLGVLKDDEQAYDKIFEYYSDQDLPEDENPVARFLGLTYREMAHPREENSYLAITRGRTEYAEVTGIGSNGQDRLFGQQRTFWKDDPSDTRGDCSLNSQGFTGLDNVISPEGESWYGAQMQFGSDIATDKAETSKFISTAPGGSGDVLLIFNVVDCSYELEQEIAGVPNHPVLSGTLLAFQDPTFTFPDAVRVFRSGSSGWFEEALLSGANGVATSSYGNGGVDMYGNIIVVGSTINVPTAFDEGVVDIYRSGSSGWILEQQIIGTENNAEFGDNVKIEGNTILVGANEADTPLDSNAGAIYIYESGSAGWTLKQSIFGDEPNKTIGDNIDFDGNTIILGEPLDDNAGLTNNGFVQVYRENDLGVWTKVLELSGSQDQEDFGGGVRVSGDIFMVSRIADPVNEPLKRVVDEYREVETNVWQKVSQISSNEGTNFASDGPGFDLNSKIAVFGNRNIDVPPSNNNEGKTFFILRNAWGFSNENFDGVDYQSNAFSPMRTDGSSSFPESGSYRDFNGELMTDSDASIYISNPLPSLCFVESANNLISGTSTDYVERLTEEIAGVNPWFDTYEDYAEDVRRLGKDCAIVSEFNTSEHMEFYVSDNNGNFRVDNRKIFSLPGAEITSSAETEDQLDYDVDFRKKYLASDRLRYFDDIKKEHEDIAEASRITLRCKGVKKLLPYQGFYPQNRTVQIGSLLSQSLAPFITGFSGSDDNDTFSPHGLQALLKPLVSPGILYNSIKGGIAVDYPIYTSSAPATREIGSNTSEFVLADAPNYRLPFETLVALTEHLPKESPVRFISSFNTEEETELVFPYYFKWDGNKDALYELAMHNFLAEVPNFFLANGTLNNYASAPEFQFKEFVADRTYYMDVVLQQNVLNNKFPTYVGTSSVKTDAARTISSFTPDPGDAFSGRGLAITDTRMAVASADTPSGSVHVYNNYGLNPWQLETVLTGATAAQIRGVDMDDDGAVPRIITSRDFGANYIVEAFASTSAGWSVQDEFIIGTAGDGNRLNAIILSGSYIAIGMNSGLAVEIWRSSSVAGWAFETAISKSGPNAGDSEFGSVFDLGADVSGNLIAIADPFDDNGASNAGIVEILRSGSSGWVLEADFSGTAINDQFGCGEGLQGVALSGSHMALSAGYFTIGNQEIRFYKSGSSGWALEQVVTPPTASSNPAYLDFSQENGWLISTNKSPSSTQRGTLQSYRSGSSGWVLETLIDQVTGSFGIELFSLGNASTRLSVKDNKFSIGAPLQTIDGDINIGAVYTFISESCGWLPLYGDGRVGEFNLRQNGRLFGMALPVTGGTVQFNKSLNVYDPAYMAYTPPSFYGEAIARISFTPTVSRKYSLEEIFENATVENILNQSGDRTAVFVDPVVAETSSLAYQNKMTVSASVTLFGKFSEPNVEFDLVNPDRTRLIPGFQPGKATRTENTNKERWSIGTKFEAPIYDVAKYDSEYSASYTSHFSSFESDTFCEFEGLEFQTPRTPWTNYADVLLSKEGVFFDVKESFAPDVYNAETGSLLQNCGFTAGRKKVGRLADQKEISEAIVAIPYIDRAIEGLTVQNASDCNRHFIKVDLETFRTQKENLEKLGIAVKREETGEGTTQKSATTITDMIQNMVKFVVPPQMDFVKFQDIHPFVMYMFDFSTILNKRDLINIWHGIMPEPAIRMEKDEIVITHEMNEDEFFHGKELPDDIRWLVFKVKQRANQNYFEVTTDASDDNRFKFDFQGDGKVEVVPDLNYNWPYDYFSLVELSKIEVEVQLTNKSEVEKLEQSGGGAARPGRTAPGRRPRRGTKGKGKKLIR